MLLFDIDGTLLLTGGAGKIAFEKAFEELFSVRQAWGNVRPDGKTDPVIIEEIVVNSLKRPLKDSEYKQLCLRYLLHFENELKIIERFQLMPGVIPLLNRLTLSPNYVLGIATGNFEQAAHLKLKRGELSHFFCFGGYGSDSHNRRELTRIAVQRGLDFVREPLDEKNIFIIGDTVHDIEAGKTVGAQVIAVATGSTSKEELVDHQPNYLLDNFVDIRKFIEIISS